jgi:catechol 2,3-dioxygenase-like lactoylglutathione lyase family enzyme
MNNTLRQTFGGLFTVCALLCASSARSQQAESPGPQAAALVPAHFHHVGLNTTDSYATMAFYTAKFPARKEKFAGTEDALWTGKSWLFFHQVSKPPQSEILSGIWHIGWGAVDMRATYQQELASGTRFATPLTDISDLTGGEPNAGSFFYAYVDGPDHTLIELNTSANNDFGHVHLLSADPPAAGAWYAKYFGFKVRTQTQERLYKDIHVAPAAIVTADHVSIIIYPQQYIKDEKPDLWKDRVEFAPTAGRAIDHLGFSVENLDDALKTLQADGVKMLSGSHNIKRGVARYAIIEGPDHVSVELIEDHSPAPAPLE